MSDNESEPSIDDLVRAWRSIIVGEKKAWVLFENGTCVILPNATGDLAQQAIALLSEWGPVHAGSPAGDFSVVQLANSPGWVVTCQHPDILTYVAPDELSPEPSELMIGIIGRGKRDDDAHELNVVHIEESTK